jgi:hypothetical protein
LGIVTLAIPMFTLFLWKSREKLSDEKFGMRYGVLYKGLKLNGAIKYFFNIWFMLRRYLYVACISLFSGSPYLQSVIPQVLSFVLLVYLIHSHPFDTPFENRLETFNELCIYLLFTLLQAFHHAEMMA